jgi:hypothetical protein
MKYPRSKLENRGYELLENPYIYPGMIERSVPHKNVRVWVYPSFEPFVSFTISKFKKSYYARRTVWDHRKQVLTEEPQTYCAEVEIQEEVMAELVSTLSEINMPPFEPAEMLGIDGVTFGVTLEQFMSESTLQWWGCYPESWHELRVWHCKYLRKLDGLFSECSIDIEQALTSGC